VNRPLLVAVSQRVDAYPERNEQRDALDQRLSQLLVSAGFIPVPVPNGFYAGVGSDEIARPLFDQWLMRVGPDAIVLSGGNDIGQNKERDATERHLLSYARASNVPVLGICRGMQMMGDWAGCGLVKVDGHTRTRHVLQKLAYTDALPAEVNSFHQWSLSMCPQGFEVLARSEQGDIEAIRHLAMPWEGWMWHPEREPVFCEADLQRIKLLFLKNGA
jgi:gamma-glutamyl-gamma-aminobutyrate hydrolase PuuD